MWIIGSILAVAGVYLLVNGSSVLGIVLIVAGAAVFWFGSETRKYLKK